jgi:3-(3-hydroxy-phenyl)propionate hydroxylase
MAFQPLVDVVVIGAGPVGLTTASELVRHGVRVRLVEKREKLLEHPNAAVVHVRTQEILDAMGTIAPFLEKGFPLPGMNVHGFGKRIGFVDIGGVDSPYPLPLCIPQDVTVAILAAHFEKLGGRIEFQTEATGLQQDADGVRVSVKHLDGKEREETIEAKYVVSCEGSHSMVREACHIDFSGERYAGKEFLQCDAYVRWTYPHGYGYQFMTEEYVLLLFPYNAAGRNRIICARTDKDPNNKQPPTLEEMQELVRRVADAGAELYNPVWFNRFRSGHRFAATFREGRAFLAGDSGHVHVPIGGQGMNYGMHDAFNLAWKLAAVIKGGAKPDLLDTYMTERHPTDEALVHGTDLGYHMIIEPHALKKVIMQNLGPTLMHFEPLQRQVRATLAELNVRYNASALTEDHGGSDGPAPGMRAPNATVVRMPSRETVPLFDVLRDPRWSLLVFAGNAPDEHTIEDLERTCASLAARYSARIAIHLVLCDTPAVPVHESWAADFIMDRERLAHAKYGVTSDPCLYLIRPDWYIAYRSSLDQAKQLSEYIARVFA